MSETTESEISPESGGAPCAAFRPGPESGSRLQADPEVHLLSPGMDMDSDHISHINRKNVDH